MEITLDENEITQAIKQFISGSGINIDGKELIVTLTAGRGTNGHSAAVKLITPIESVDETSGNTMQEPFEMPKADPVTEIKQPVKKAKTKTAVKKKTTPKEEPEPVEIKKEPESPAEKGSPVGEAASDVESLFDN